MRPSFPSVQVAAAVPGPHAVAIVAFLGWKVPGSHRELARTLGAQLQAGDRVAFIDDYLQALGRCWS